MRVTTPTQPMRVPATPPAAAPLEPGAPPPNDSFTQLAKREAVRNGRNWANATGSVAGGTTALVLMTGGLYAGVLGGAVVGSALGLGVAPVLAALGSSGAKEFLGSVFATTTLGTKAGIVLGGLAVAAGAIDAGVAVGNVIGKSAGFLAGAPVGFARGGLQAYGLADKHEDKPARVKAKVVSPDFNELRPAVKFASAALGGVGLVAGGVGGAVLAGSLATAGSLVSGLLARNVSMAALSGAAGVGAVFGGLTGAFLGGRGGYKLARGLEKGADWVQQGIAYLATRREHKKVAFSELSSSQLMEMSNRYHSRGDSLGLATLVGLPFIAPIAGTLVGELTNLYGGLAAGLGIPLAMAVTSSYFMNKSEKLEKLARSR